MAYTSDKKPGALTQVTVLANTDNVVVEQSGDVKRATLSQVEAKIFASKTATSTPTGTEVTIVRLTDGNLRQVALADIVPVGNITNAKISDSAAIADTKLATIATAGKVLNSATTATADNTNNAIVARDGSGNFSATGVTATTFTGTLAGSITGSAPTLTTGRTIALTGDVTGTTDAFNGSANVSAATTIANNAVTTAKIADANVTTAKIADANVTTAKIADSNVTLEKLVAAVQQSLVPAGAVQAFAMNSAPSGWLAANGSNVSRSTYAALFSAIGTTYGAGDGSTTFALPDLRGYFLRGTGTNSDGTASGTFGAKTADALKTHTHSVSGNTGTESAGHTHSVSGSTSSNGAHQHTTYANRLQDAVATGNSFRVNTLEQWGFGNNQGSTSSNGDHTHTFSTTSGGVSANHTHGVNITSGNPSTGTSDETRPKNIAMLYCIKF
jgi:microcystin-dependent protein